MMKLVLKTMLEQQLKTIDATNPYPAASDDSALWIEDDISEITETSFGDALDGDIVLNYSYMDDELQGSGRIDTWEGSDCEKWLAWYDDKLFPQITKLMNNFYKQVDSMDGSGNGLYYGAILYRKK